MLRFTVYHFISFMPAFHILNNTTIQFKLEKIPIERESELTFSLSPDDLGTSSIMKIEGKFVNPVQVNSCQSSWSHMFILTLYKYDIYLCTLHVERKIYFQRDITHAQYHCWNLVPIIMESFCCGESILSAFFIWRKGGLSGGRWQILNSVDIQKWRNDCLRSQSLLSQEDIILVTLRHT